jgi:hypothetical protein
VWYGLATVERVFEGQLIASDELYLSYVLVGEFALAMGRSGSLCIWIFWSESLLEISVVCYNL